jgi:hypothetical protein
MNTLSVMRLLSQLQGNGRPQPALVPLDTGRGRYEDEEERPRQRRRPSPPKKERKKKAPPPESSSEEEDGYGSPSSSDYSSYDEPEVIKRRYAEDPCENISPAALNSKKTKKEVVNYLEEKQCPKIEKNAKRKHQPPASKAVSNPAPPAAHAPPPPSAPVPPPAPAAPAAPSAEVGKKKMGRPKKPVDATKPKKPPTAYNQLVGKFRKEGKTFAEAAKAAKAEMDAKKQKPE